MPASPRSAAPADDYDLSDVAMTPVMEAMHELGTIANSLKHASAVVADLVLDTTEGGWTEGHSIGDMLKTQSRPFSDRNTLRNHLSRRIDVTEDWRTRLRGAIEPRTLPDYLSADEFTDLVMMAKALSDRLSEIDAKREAQYPNYHRASVRATDRGAKRS